MAGKVYNVAMWSSVTTGSTKEPVSVMLLTTIRDLNLLHIPMVFLMGIV